jgi:CRP-like cAMP-binding protein
MHNPHNNLLINALPREDKRRFLAGCQHVKLVLGDEISKPNQPIRYVYFPIDSIISLESSVDGHSSLEVALVGNEGMHGIPLALGIDSSLLRALVQGEGTALYMKAAHFRRELQQNPALQRILNHYIYVRMRQLAQTAACTRFHIVEERLARWLLMTQDRTYSADLHMTHEFLSFMLGVRRVGITKAAISLQRRKLINYTRGIITVLDRRGLEDAACSCYRADKATYERIIGKYRFPALSPA